jgi:Ni,Fe-hydrogenase maturation factor
VTTQVATGSSASVSASPDPAREEAPEAALVEVLACGDPERGDDGASVAALAELVPDLPSDVSIRLVGQLGIDDLLAVPPGAGAVVVDTATGVDPGCVVEIPFIGIASRSSAIRARSSVALSRPEAVGLASMIRGRPLVGVLVAIGGASFRPGDALSWTVTAGLCSFQVAIVDAIERVRAQVIANAHPHASRPRSSKEDRPVDPIAVRA